MNSILSDIILRLAKGSDQTFFQERYRNECKKASEDDFPGTFSFDSSAILDGVKLFSPHHNAPN